MSEGQAELRLLRGYMNTERPVIARSSQIGDIFINKPQIWVLNNYILSWKTITT